jgi:hypothetical protein
VKSTPHSTATRYFSRSLSLRHNRVNTLSTAFFIMLLFRACAHAVQLTMHVDNEDIEYVAGAILPLRSDTGRSSRTPKSYSRWFVRPVQNGWLRGGNPQQTVRSFFSPIHCHGRGKLTDLRFNLECSCKVAI